ncbi:hypothetical protein Pcinc_034400, partial [Petrolisthes cinctipes]
MCSCVVCVYGDIQEPPPKITIDPNGEVPLDSGGGSEGAGANVEVVTEGDVLVLTRDNFKHVIDTNTIILVQFYAPWCGHCKKLAPEFAEAASELQPEGLHLGKVDCTKEPELAKEYLVSAYPTIKLFKDSQPVLQYDGVGSKQGLVDYMRTHSDPNYTPGASSVLQLTDANFTSVINSKELILVDFYAPWCKHCLA